MNIKHIWLAGVAVAALAGGVATAQAGTKAEEDAITRQLNLDQLAKAKGGEFMPTQAQTPANDKNGQGGPEFKGPPGSNEGMTDENAKPDQTAPDDSAPPPDEESTTPPAQQPEDKPAPPKPSPY